MHDQLDPGLEALLQPEAEGVGAALRGGGLVLGSGGALLAVELVLGHLEGLEQQGAHLRGELAADLVVAVVGEVEREGAVLGRVGLAGGVVRAGVAAVEPAPLADQALDVGGGAVAGEGEEFGLVAGGGGAGQGAHLRVGDLALREGGRDEGQGGEAARDADLLAGGPERDAGAPGEPVGAGAAALPAALLVVDPEQGEEAVGGGVDVGAERGDPVAERIVAGARVVAGDASGAAGAGGPGPAPGAGGAGWAGAMAVSSAGMASGPWGYGVAGGCLPFLYPTIREMFGFS